ncbi:MAG: glycosyltransferase family 2 protein [Roseburia sp.]|nr:glycosyltransferase family 2 protein [Roseburia sp.]
MDTHKFFVEKLRFHLKNRDTLVFVGWFFDGSTKGHELKAYLDGKELPLELRINRGAEVRQKYIRSINEIEEEVVGIIELPADWRDRGAVTLMSAFEGEVRRACRITTRKLKKCEAEVGYYIEKCHREPGKVSVAGWCMAAGEIKLELLDGNRQPVPIKVEHYYRKDLLSVFPEADAQGKPGFLVEASVGEKDRGAFFLEMRDANRRSCVRLTRWDEGTRLQYLTEKAGDTVRYLKRNGVSATVYKIQSKLSKKEGNTYDNWRKKYMVTPEELERQRQEPFADGRKFSVVVPLYKTKPAYLREMIDSICAQTYPNWELCMALALSGDGDDKLTAILDEYAAKDSRIRYITLPQNEGISGNTNAALAMAAGDYIVLADHDDIVPANALYEFAAAVHGDASIDMLYSDEDKVDMDGKKYFEPHFKPDFNIDLLCSVNYICHLLAVRRDVAERAGSFRTEFDGAQDLDFILRCSECAKHIYHVPKILYHWRCHMDSTAANPESKLYAFEAGRRAVEEHYRRLGIPARVENAQFYGMYRTIYEWKEEPLVSIIIPNKDHAEDLAKCIDSIYEKSDYRNFEFVIVENNSTEQKTFDYYKKLEAEHENVHVVYYEGGFNYSKINNFGAAAAKGEYFLLLNNDTELIDGSAIRELLGYCMREDVGIVGAKLLYEDDTIQHAGVVVGFGGTAGHAFIGKSRYDTGYFGRILCAQDYTAVTAACMMTKRAVFEEVGGMTEELAVAFNDVDYCLKVRRTGKLVVYNPYAELYHYESKSRGYEDSPGKVERFNGEVEILLSRWRELIEGGDPCYNPNLTLDNSDFSLRR